MKNSTIIKSIKKSRSSIAGAAIILAWSMLITGCSMKYSRPGATDSSVAEYYDIDMTQDEAAMGAVNSKQSYSRNAEYGMEENGTYSNGTAESGTIMNESSLEGEKAQKESSRKLIRNANITMETTQPDELAADITEKTKELGGYIEYSWMGDNGYNSDDTRYMNYTLRIPADRLDEFLNTALKAGKITSQSENVEDITLRYSDLESRVRTLETEQERLLELIRDAQDVDAIIALETRLSEIRYELDSIKSSLKLYDNQVAYSTVTLYISEVRVVSAAKNAGFAERIAAGLEENLIDLKEKIENSAITLIISIPAIIVFIIFAVVLLFIIKLILKLIFKILGIKMPEKFKAKKKDKQKTETVSESNGKDKNDGGGTGNENTEN